MITVNKLLITCVKFKRVKYVKILGMNGRVQRNTVCQNSLRTGDKNIPKQMIHKDNHIYHLITFSNGSDLKSD